MFIKRIYGNAGVFLLRLLGSLPLGLSRRLARPLAPLARALMKRRRNIAARNLELCFPQLDPAARSALLKRHFRNLAEALAEIAWSWAGPARVPGDLARIDGLENLTRSDGRGILLVTGHSTCLEIAGRALAEHARLAGIYRPLRNPVLERFQCAGRGRYTDAMFRRDDVRGAVRRLRSGGILWYAPDQDFGPERSVFVPFFDHPAATLRGMVELARLGRAVIVPMYPFKDERSGKITLVIEPAFEDNDESAMLARYNAFLERMIRRAPAQYWWLHRRFKTAPAGMPDRYNSPD